MRKARKPLPLALVALALSTIAVLAGCDISISDREDPPPSNTPSPPGSPGETGPSAASAADQDSGALLLIMDASGSMNATDSSGRTLLDGAKQALRDVLATLPDGQQVGLRVYGHRVPNTDRANGCQDTELIHPVAPLDRPALQAVIDGYQAVGFTPIGRSLQAAAGDLPPEGRRTIILVSDGEDTCAPPEPCEVADDLTGEGIDLVIHTVGFALGDDDQARSQLECIAEAGNGRFAVVDEAGDLANAIEEAARGERGFTPTGGTLEGAPTPREAVTGLVDTSYTDIVRGEETNFYRFEITPGSRVVGELTRLGNPQESGYHCALVHATDVVGQEIASGGESGGLHDATATLVWGTDPVVVPADQVWLKVVTHGCGGHQGRYPDSEFEVEIRLTLLG